MLIRVHIITITELLVLYTNMILRGQRTRRSQNNVYTQKKRSRNCRIKGQPSTVHNAKLTRTVTCIFFVNACVETLDTLYYEEVMTLIFIYLLCEPFCRTQDI